MENTKIIQLKKALKEISGFDVKRFIIIASGDLPDGRQRDTVAFEGNISEIAITVAMNMIADQDTRKIILKAAEILYAEEDQLKKTFEDYIQEIYEEDVKGE